VALFTLVGLVSACGVSSDSGPRDVKPEERPTDLLVTTIGSPTAGTGSTVYFLGPSGPGQNPPLISVSRASSGEATALLTALIEGPTPLEQDAEGLRTAIPQGTTLRAASMEGQGTLRVDVSSELLTSAGNVLLDALSQIVFTGLGLSGVERIRLLVDGQPQDWPTSSGDSTRDPLTMFDFPDRIPFDQPDYPALPGPTSPTTSTSSTTPPTSVVAPRTTSRRTSGS